AGASNMSFWRFVAFGAAGSALRSVALVALGYAFGANLERAMTLLGSINAWLVVVFGAGLLLFFGVRYMKTRRGVGHAGAIGEDGVHHGLNDDLGNSSKTSGPHEASAGAKGASLTSRSSKESSQS
ncbi:MAG TPA: hypothetical protein VGL13_10405, partial [Polyangiaceae bacterium]